MDLIIFLVIGALAGWLAGVIMKGGGFGVIGDIIVGILGSFVGGWLLPKVGLSIGGDFGGFITAVTGGAPDGNLIPIPKPVSDAAMDSAQCIGCGACVAACPNGAASLFTGAKIAHLNRLPQGQAERYKRTEAMVETMDEHFGSCTNHGECSAACPKEISIDVIALMNKDYRASKFKSRKELSRS